MAMGRPPSCVSDCWKTKLTEMLNQDTASGDKKSKFLSDVLKLVSGTTIVQVIGVLASPILARLFGPEAFGLFAVFSSIVRILVIFMSLRYEFAIMLPESNEEAVNILAVSLGSATLISLLFVPFIWIGGPMLLQWLNSPGLVQYLWMIPLALFFGGLDIGHPALNYWAVRVRRFEDLTLTRVINQVVATGLKLAFGFAGFVSTGILIGANVIGAVISPLVLVWRMWPETKALMLRAVNWNAMGAGIKRYRKFPIYGIWSALLNTFSWQLPVFLLARYFSSTVVGFYSLGFRILQLPMSLIGAAIAQVFFSRAAEAHAQGELTPLVDSVFDKLVKLGIFPTLVLGIVGAKLFALIFGSDWYEAGVYVQILSVWAFFWFISSPLSTLLSVLEMQRFELQFNILLLVMRFIALSIGGILKDARLSIFLFSISGVVLYAYLCLVLLSKSNLSMRRIIEVFGNATLTFSFFGIALLFINYKFSNEWFIFGTTGILTLMYYFLLYKQQPNLFGRK